MPGTILDITTGQPLSADYFRWAAENRPDSTEARAVASGLAAAALREAARQRRIDESRGDVIVSAAAFDELTSFIDHLASRIDRLAERITAFERGGPHGS
jgi:hypothetical protein